MLSYFSFFRGPYSSSSGPLRSSPVVAALGLKAGQLRDWGTKPGPVIRRFQPKDMLIIYLVGG